ncbi:MAG: hypothetical protein HY929_07440 [Euryarchaeota archaeon]|nr:hypothetical protein [Euryarchaeota archaeon]
MDITTDIPQRLGFETKVSKFEEFLQRYCNENVLNLGLYPEKKSLIINFADLDKFDSALADELIKYPDQTIQAAEAALKQIISRHCELSNEVNFHVRFKNLFEKTPVREIRSEHIGKLIEVEGVVRKSTDVRPKVVKAIFRCKRCGEEISILQFEKFRTPFECTNCQRTGQFDFLIEKSNFIDAQKIRIQEPLEGLRGGEQPKQIDIYLEEDLTGKVTPGDPVEIVGILKSQRKFGDNSTVFEIFLDCNYVETLEKEFEELEITPEDEKAIKALANDPEIYRKIRDSIAPHIYGHDEIKEAIMLQLFSSPAIHLPDKARIRGDPHVILIGEPATGKCLTKDMELILRDGQVIKIGEFIENVFKSNKSKIFETSDGRQYIKINNLISALSLYPDLKIKQSNISIVWRRKYSGKILNIFTRSGRQIKVTPEHPLFTIQEGKVVTVPTRAFEVGDYLATPRRISIVGKSQELNIKIRRGKTNAFHISIPNQTTPGLMRFLGYLIGEGSSLERVARFSNSDPILINDFIKISKKLFGIVPHHYIYSRSRREVQITSIEVKEFIKKLGREILENSNKKALPCFVFKCSDEEIGNLVKAIFDGEATVSKTGKQIEITLGSRSLIKQLQILLLRMGIISYFRPTFKYATNSKNKIKRKYFRLWITGRDNLIAFYKNVGFQSQEKRKRLQRAISKLDLKIIPQTNVDVIPKIGKLLRNLRKASKLTKHDLGLSNVAQFRAYELGKKNPSRQKLLNIVFDLSRSQQLSNGGSLNKGIQNLKKLAESDIYWDKIIKIKETLTDEYVYDLTIEGTPNFIANGIIVHNSEILQFVANNLAPRGIYTSGKGSTKAGLTAAAVRDEFAEGSWSLEAGALVLADRGSCAIDEFEKMSEDDRSAMHQAMEQQSYHPSVEILFTGGEKIKIGTFVEGLFEKYSKRKIIGYNCEILPIKELNIQLWSTDFNKTFPINVNRVSRHKAPPYFIRLRFSNGREIIVTPSHPIYVSRNSKIIEVFAEEVEIGEYVPAPRKLPLTRSKFTLDTVDPWHFNLKRIKIPNKLSPSFGRLLGYQISEGHAYFNESNRYAELGVTNSDGKVINEMTALFLEKFSLNPYTQVKNNWGTSVSVLRYPSRILYAFYQKNFPEILKGATAKRIPKNIFGTNIRCKIEFLKAAFIGDGFVDSERFGYRTASRKLAEDMQDVFWQIGIDSYISRDDNYFKVVITGTQSMLKFANKIVEDWDWRYKRIQRLIARSKKVNRSHDVSPPDVVIVLKDMLKKMHMDDGYLNEHIKQNYGITLPTLQKYIKRLENSATKAKKKISTLNNAREIRKISKISLLEVAKAMQLSTSMITYIERNKASRYRELLIKVKELATEKLKELEKSISRIKYVFLNSDLRWGKIVKKEIIPNAGNYKNNFVYDVTVEPTNTFVSEGLVLHNSVSIAKAGIVATLNARTAILAAANPKYGRFDKYKSMAEQINLSPTLLSRFDLIFFVEDDLSTTREMAKHILNSVVEPEKILPPIEPEFLRKYIAYSRQHIVPQLSKEARDKIETFFTVLREQVAGDRSSPVPMTARQLWAIIRLSRSSARVRLSNEVTLEDVGRAIRLVNLSLKQAGIDFETGKLDIDKIEIGITMSQRDKIVTILAIIEAVEDLHEGLAPLEEVLAETEKRGIERRVAEELIEMLRKRGDLISPRHGIIKKA